MKKILAVFMMSLVVVAIALTFLIRSGRIAFFTMEIETLNDELVIEAEFNNKDYTGYYEFTHLEMEENYILSKLTLREKYQELFDHKKYLQIFIVVKKGLYKNYIKGFSKSHYRDRQGLLKHYKGVENLKQLLKEN